MRRSLSRKPLALVAGLAAAAGACVNGGAPGVRVEALQADIVFGVEKPEDRPTAPVGGPSIEDTGGTITVSPRLNVPFRNKLPDRFKGIFDEIPGGSVDCPSAPSGAAPRETAERNATEPPSPGLYRYRISGTRTYTFNGVDIKTQVSGFEPRIVRAVQETSATAWTFETVEPLEEGSRVIGWAVNTDAQQAQAKPPYLGENPVRVGQPGNGIAIESIADHDEQGNDIGSFDATPALLMLPLPVLPGEAFQSIALDRRGQSMTVDAETRKAQSVDACGELADGWLVEMTVANAQGLSTTSTTEEWIFSTPMGGLPISHRVQGTIIGDNGTTVRYDLTYSLAQIDPTPFEEEAE